MRVLLAIPVLVILIAFALSNQQVVRLGLWPTDIGIDLPVSVAVLLVAALFFVVGAFMVWGSALSARSRARGAERTVRQLEAQLDAMRARPASVPMLPPG